MIHYYPRYIILRKPEDWYVSFYKFFSETKGFFSFIIKDRFEDKNEPEGFREEMSDFDTFVERAMNLKDFFIKNPERLNIVNSILQEQHSLQIL